MFQAKFTLSRDFFYILVSFDNCILRTLSTTSAILKDAFAVFATIMLLSERIDGGQDKKRIKKIRDVTKFHKKYAVFVVAFICEDLGQVLCQETSINTFRQNVVIFAQVCRSVKSIFTTNNLKQKSVRFP